VSSTDNDRDPRAFVGALLAVPAPSTATRRDKMAASVATASDRRGRLQGAASGAPTKAGTATAVGGRQVPATTLAIAVVIPCLNEEATIGELVREVRDAATATGSALPVVLQAVYVVDNGSTDRTAAVAHAAGAIVVSEPRRGYGRACLSGVLAADGADLIVLLDGDRSDTPSELPRLLTPLLTCEADLIVGSRTLGSYEPGSLLPQQIVGNWIAANLLRLLYGVRVTDVGPFRVVRRADLLALGMREMTYGWPVEMLARGARAGLRIHEVPVTYRKRAGGESKVSGDFRASIRAGWRIVATIIRCRR
jgi:glycosyltransferase involved in cell wall biosynthesis